MKAKPANCKAHAIKKFVPDKKMRQEENRKKKKSHKTQHVAFDPKLTIAGKEIAFIHSQPVRFLGKLIY